MNLLVLPLIWMLYQSTKSELVLPLECRTQQEPIYDFVIFPQLPGDQSSDVYWTQLNLASGENDPIWVGESKGWLNERAAEISLGIGNPEGTFKALADNEGKFLHAELVLRNHEPMRFICPIRRKKNKKNDSPEPSARRPSLIHVPPSIVNPSDLDNSPNIEKPQKDSDPAAPL